MSSVRHSRPPLSASLFGATRGAVLGLFYEQTDRRYYHRQVVRELGLGFGAVQRELAALTRGGILTRVVEGRQVYYQADRECPVFDELRGLARKALSRPRLKTEFTETGGH